MPARSRTFDDRTLVAGSYVRTTAPASSLSRTRDVGLRGTCDDFVGNRDGANAFLSNQTRFETMYLDGEHANGYEFGRFQNYPIDWSGSFPSPLVGYPNLTVAEKTAFGNRILAESNVSNPHVNVPAFIAELRDLPSLVKDWGGGLITKAAKGYISWRWAVKPMIGDLRKLCDFTGAVNKRIRLLETLREKRNIRKRVNLRSQERVVRGATRTSLHSSSGVSYSAYRDIWYTDDVWGTTQWRLAPGVNIPKDSQALRNQAWLLTFGITTFGALQTAWELTPWSWFVDWFAGVGDFLEAHNNSIPCDPISTCIMHRRTAKSSYREPTGVLGNYQISGSLIEDVVRKERFVVSPNSLPPLELPFLTESQWSILGALAAVRDPVIWTGPAKRRVTKRARR